METMETDKMLNTFFGEYKQEIQDNGFSKRVLQKLPVQKDLNWIVWVFSAIGMAISMYLGLNLGLLEQIFRVVENFQLYYFVAIIFCFPLVGAIAYFFAFNKKYELF